MAQTRQALVQLPINILRGSGKDSRRGSGMWADNNKCHSHGGIGDVSADAFCARRRDPGAKTHAFCCGPGNFCGGEGDGTLRI